MYSAVPNASDNENFNSGSAALMPEPCESEPSSETVQARHSSEASTLETYHNNRKLVGCGCKSRFCPECTKRLGWETRQVLVAEKANLFKKPQLLSLTIDPKRFSSQEEAFIHITEGGYIRRLLRLLHITVWVWVLEPQKSGMPHWHILVDMSDRGSLSPKDLRRVWYLWRDKWKLGGLKLSRKHKGFRCPSHALNYITKYMMKEPEHGWPKWILKRQVRCVQASKAVGAILFRRSEGEALKAPPKRRRRIKRTTLERIESCKTKCVLVERSVDTVTGNIGWKFRKLVEVDYESMLSFLGVIDFDIGADVVRDDDGRYSIEVYNTGRFLAFVAEHSESFKGRRITRYSELPEIGDIKNVA